MQLKREGGESIVTVMIAVAVLAVAGVAIGNYLSTYKVGVLSAKKAGAVSDLDGFLRRNADCRKTVATNYAACQSASFVPLDKTYSASCKKYETADAGLRAEMSKTYEISDYWVACRKIGVDEAINPTKNEHMYEVSANYKRANGGKDFPLFTPPMQCEVKIMPATHTFVSGWDARNYVVTNFQWLPYDDGQGHASGSFWVRPDTIRAVCAVAGYRNYANLPPFEDYTSCGDNSAFWWNAGTKKFVYENSCAKNGQLWHGGAVVCKDPIGGVQPCP